MSTAIRIENVSKLYRLGEVGTGSLAHDINRWWHRLRGKEDPYAKIGQVNDRTQSSTKNQAPGTKNNSTPDYVWALRDVSFDVKQGEVLGIIGRNGAGKSTLLKLLSRVTKPTTGTIRSKGRIASLLEVGTGFHPELTGRENIYLNGAILGMRKHEIIRKLDEIVDFSGCERYIDTPVKRYSSGMYVRLAFAVAAHMEPSILIVDEVLAVGDASFQKKCLGKMKEVSGEGGRTVLFVSHNMTAVRSLCSRAILMRAGQIVADDNIESVVHTYENTELKESLHRKWDDTPVDEHSGLPCGIHLKEAKVLTGGQQAQAIRVNDSLELAFCVRSDRRAKINLSPHYIGAAGEVLFAAPSPVCVVEPGDNWFVCQVPADLLNDGIYSLRVLVVEEGPKVLQTVNDALVVEVHELQREGAWLGKWPGVIRPKFEWDFRPQLSVD